MNDIPLYPANIALKVFIDNEEPLKNEIIDIIKQAFPKVKKKDITSSESSNQKYLSLTFLIHVQQKEDIDKLYETLSHHPKVKMVL